MGERKLAVELFNRAWELMRRAERTAAEDDELLHVAHASRYHWIAAGTTIDCARRALRPGRLHLRASTPNMALPFGSVPSDEREWNPRNVADFRGPALRRAA